MFTSLVFDIGGVLINTKIAPDILESLSSVLLLPIGLVLDKWKYHYNNLLTGTLTPYSFVKEVIEENEIKSDPGVVVKLWESKIRITENCINKPVINYVKNMRDKNGIKTYILSNMIDLMDSDTRLNEIKQNFDGVYYSFQLGSRKPLINIYNKFIDKTGINPHNAIFVDDNQENVDNARQLGFCCHLYQNNHGLFQFLNSQTTS